MMKQEPSYVENGMAFHELKENVLSELKVLIDPKGIVVFNNTNILIVTIENLDERSGLKLTFVAN